MPFLASLKNASYRGLLGPGVSISLLSLEKRKEEEGRDVTSAQLSAWGLVLQCEAAVTLRPHPGKGVGI